MSLTTFAFVLIAAAGCVCALFAARNDAVRAYMGSKALGSLGFIGVALSVGATHAVWSRVVLVALLLSAVGDVALAVPGNRGFLIGLGSFALAHVTYVGAFLLHGVRTGVLLVTGVFGALVAGTAWLTLRGLVSGRLRRPVEVYVAIVSAMLAVGFASAYSHRAWLLGCGVVLVVGSDAAVARERFLAPGPANKVVGLPAYYAGQLLIALSLVAK